MASPCAGKKRIDNDLLKLIELKHEVILKGNMNEFTVKFHGPTNTYYEGGVWRVRVLLPDNYPFKSPCIGFVNKIFHPNIDEMTGAVCLDVINQNWSALYDLSNIFESFLPQLLTYPNPVDPLNEEAANLFLSNQEEYKLKIQSYISKYATEEAIEYMDEDDESSDTESSLSEYEDKNCAEDKE